MTDEYTSEEYADPKVGVIDNSLEYFILNSRDFDMVHQAHVVRNFIQQNRTKQLEQLFEELNDKKDKITHKISHQYMHTIRFVLHHHETVCHPDDHPQISVVREMLDDLILKTNLRI